MKLTNEICISFLRGSGWLYNHDKEITISERNKAIDDLLGGMNQITYNCQDADELFEKICDLAEQLKAGGKNV